MLAGASFVFLTVGIISLSNDQANPYEPTNVTCIIRTADPNSDTGNIFLNIDGYLVSLIYFNTSRCTVFG